MARLRNPELFSEHFGIDPDHLARAGAFDPVLNMDTPLFIDPTLLGRFPFGPMQRAHRTYIGWFTRLGALLAKCREVGDKHWEEAVRALKFPEPPATCLGNTVGGVDGNGIGEVLALLLAGAAFEVVTSGTLDGRSMSCLPFLFKGFGPDRISDMTTRIILPHLAEYTVGVVQGFDMDRMTLRLKSDNYEVPAYNGRPVLLVPLYVLGEMRVAADIVELDRVAKRNSDVRQRVSALLEGTLRVGAKNWLSELVTLAIEGNPKALAAFVDFHDAATERYNFGADAAGHMAWRQMLGASRKYPLALADLSPLERTTAILNQFESLVQLPEVSRHLFRDATGVDARPVRALRLLFFAIAHSYCKAHAGFAAEYDTDDEVTTFVERRTPVLRVDLASSRQGNLEQRYEKACEEGRLFLLIDFANRERVEQLVSMANARKKRKLPAAEVRVVEV